MINLPTVLWALRSVKARSELSSRILSSILSNEKLWIHYRQSKSRYCNTLMNKNKIVSAYNTNFNKIRTLYQYIVVNIF